MGVVRRAHAQRSHKNRFRLRAILPHAQPGGDAASRSNSEDGQGSQGERGDGHFVRGPLPAGGQEPLEPIGQLSSAPLSRAAAHGGAHNREVEAARGLAQGSI
ncbi:hypothetical protein PybrP1_007379 [[Pythium] brassicae (nom. inval.)]|nr:hypothetical protein PybrP1_007379 [[Pythium] brassicae (nom. inval.)]